MNLLDLVEKLKKSEVGDIVRSRIREFEKMGKKSEKEIFKELCFCILTANFNAKRCIYIQNKLGDGFLTLDERELANMLKKFGHRFPNTRAKFIVESRKHIEKLADVIKLNDEKKIREWLVKNIKGLGYKEASHFLRNIGLKNVAIIDFHVLNLLKKHGLVKWEKRTLTKKKYLEIENILKELARELDITLAELDLYLWFIETNEVLK